jgi:hypothetical protein
MIREQRCSRCGLPVAPDWLDGDCTASPCQGHGARSEKRFGALTHEDRYVRRRIDIDVVLEEIDAFFK